jgi:hypothetical protein
MSPKSRKYERIEELFHESTPAAPDSGPAAVKPPLPAGDRPPATAPRGRNEPAAPAAMPPSPPNVLSIPLTVGGKTIGAVQAAGGEAWTGREIKVVCGAAARLAEHLEKIFRSAAAESTESKK